MGAKRFSFLAREFTRQGYDVHVITHDSQDWINWKTDASLPLAATVHGCAAAIKLPPQGGGLLQRAANSLVRRLLAPIGWEALWARVATRRALQVARGLPPGVVIATSPAHAALIADTAGIERVLEQLKIGEVTASRAHVERYRWSNLALQYRTVIETLAGVPADAATPTSTAPARRALDP